MGNRFIFYSSNCFFRTRYINIHICFLQCFHSATIYLSSLAFFFIFFYTHKRTDRETHTHTLAKVPSVPLFCLCASLYFCGCVRACTRARPRAHASKKRVSPSVCIKSEKITLRGSSPHSVGEQSTALCINDRVRSAYAGTWRDFRCVRLFRCHCALLWSAAPLNHSPGHRCGVTDSSILSTPC